MSTRQIILIVLATLLATSIFSFTIDWLFTLDFGSRALIFSIGNVLACSLCYLALVALRKEPIGVLEAEASLKEVMTEGVLGGPDIKKLSLVASSMHSAVLFTDLAGRITWVNHGFCRISGYSFEEVIGRKPGDFLQGAQTDPESIRRMRLAISRRERTRTEILNYTKTGKIYWLDIEIMPLVNEAGEVEGFMSVQSEITALKQAIEAQEEAALQMKTILDHAPMVVFMKHRDGKYLFFNDRYKKAVNRPELVAGMTDYDIFDKEFSDLCREKDAEIMNGEQVVQYEMKVGGRDFFELKFPIQNQHNLVYAIGGISIDVTDFKTMQNALVESELKFRLITEAAPVYIWMTDIKGEPTFFNHQWLQFVGKPFKEAVKMDWRREIHADDLEICEELFTLHHATPKDMSCTYRFRNGEGVYRWLQMKAVPRKSSDGDFLGYIGSSVDVTEQIEVKNKLEQLLEEKEFLIREIHHRVKNNLQVMSSVLFLKAQTLKDPAMRLLLAQSRQRLRSMALIHETLMQSGSQVTKIDIKNYLVGLIHEQKHALSVDPECVTVEANVDQEMMNIEQVVNLGFIVNETFTNAVKYAFPVQRSGLIKISFIARDKYYILEIKDNGVGLPAHVTLDNSDLFGVQLVKIFANHLHAELFLDGSKGTTWRLTFQKEPMPK